MPRPMTEAEREAFLAEPRTAIISVASGGDRPPLAVPIHYAYEPGGDITLFTNTERRTSRKSELIARAGGHFTLTVQHTEWPYRYVTVECTVVRTDQPPSTEQILGVTGPFMPEEAARALAASETDDPESTMILYTARPDRWLAMDFGEEPG
jgi:uncharacterized protein